MSSTTVTDRDFDVQTLTDTVQGQYAQKDAFDDSVLVRQGAVMVSPTMPQGPDFIGNEITVPRFGVIGEMEDNDTDADTEITPKKLLQTHEKGTVKRGSLSFQVSHWAQHSGPQDLDPYEEASRQIRVATARYMGKKMLDAAAGSPLALDVYDAGTPQLLDWDTMLEGRAMWGDENEDVVGAVVHSRTMLDLRKLRDGENRPLLVENMREHNLPMFAGVPLIESDRVPLTGSVMGTVAESGSTPPDATLAGAPLGPWNLVIECVVGGAHATATFRFSTDGGKTWSATIATPAVDTPIDLIDTASDSLVGVNGKTGLTVEWAAGTFNADNAWTATAQLKVRTILLKRGALAFWFNARAAEFLTDKNILKHTDIAAMHLYYVAHRYTRAPGSTKPGAVVIAHNVSGF